MNQEYVPTAARPLHLCVYIDIKISQRSPAFPYSNKADVQVKAVTTLASIKKGTSPLALFFCDPMLNRYYSDSEIRHDFPLRDTTSHENILCDTRN